MLRFRTSFDEIKLNDQKWSIETIRALEDLVYDAMKEALKEIILKVPVYTGMAMGSLQPIGRYLNVAVPISPHARARYYKNKSPELGEAAQHFEFSEGTSRVSVKLSIDVVHYLINEFHNVQAEYGIPLKNPTPWHSFEAGRAAFRMFLRTNLKSRVPQIAKFITRTRVTI